MSTSAPTSPERFSGLGGFPPARALPSVGDPAVTALGLEEQLPAIDGLRICCIGAGYVGGPTMAVIAKSAHPCISAPSSPPSPAR